MPNTHNNLSELFTGIADAIRSKTGSTDPIVADEFPTAIDAIEAGGGEASDLDKWFEGTLTEVNSQATTVAKGVLQSNNYIVKAHFPLATSVGEDALYYCSKLETVDFPALPFVNTRAFSYCGKLANVNVPMAKTIGQGAFYRDSALKTIDLPVATSIYREAFDSCGSLTAVILRSETVCTLLNEGAFYNMPVHSGTGYIYVPSALVDTYKSATNWSRYATQFRALEDYTVDGTITGKLDESKI